MTQTRRQLTRFLVVGFTAVAIDFISYRLLLALGVELDLAKACGFTVGAAFAYVANRSWTFMKREHGFAPVWFALLYGATLFINTFVNGFIVRWLPPSSAALAMAFLVATAISATLNFLGMKWIVFRENAV